MIKLIKKILPSGLVAYLGCLWQYRTIKRRAAAVAERNRKKIEFLMQGTLPIKLEMGADKNRGITGWTYVDSNDQCELELDLVKPLPFPDDSIDSIYSSHLLEHFKYEDLINFLVECRRILKSGGSFSAAVPNARLYLDAYHNPDSFNPEVFCRYKQAYNYNSKIDYVNYIAYMDGEHKYMFDEENLIEVIKRVGFRNTALRDFDEVLDLRTRNFQTIYVKAEK